MLTTVEQKERFFVAFLKNRTFRERDLYETVENLNRVAAGIPANVRLSERRKMALFQVVTVEPDVLNGKKGFYVGYNGNDTIYQLLFHRYLMEGNDDETYFYSQKLEEARRRASGFAVVAVNE